MYDHVIEKLAYDRGGLNLCKAIKQKVHIELDVFNMDDTHAVRDLMKQLGYIRTDFKLTSNEHVKMDFEKG